MRRDKIKRICLWSGPRNISTAMMYSFAQRSDTRVVDEPLYAHYLHTTDAKEYHPGAREVLSSMETNGEKVIEQMLYTDDKPVIFFKQMAHHLVHIDYTFLDQMINIILTRDPEEMITSYIEQIEAPEMKDVGYLKQYELLTYLQKRRQKPVVIIAKDLLMQPEKKLKRLCRIINIPFDKAMLKWERGSRHEDGVWAPYWYKNVHQSTGFIPYVPKERTIPGHLQPLLNECVPIYRELSKYAI